ncbi:hypothetical protein Bca101_082280 [Brassica carinata]
MKQGSENILNGGVSWVEIAQEKKALKKYDLQIIDMEGEKAVEIPDEVIDKADLLWEDYLIGKFLDTAPHVARVHAIVNRIWNQGGSKQLIDEEKISSGLREKEKDGGVETTEVIHEKITEVELEEGELEENWQDVTPEKAGRSTNLKFGQVKILTPSRFTNLMEVDEKGDEISVIETEEILSIVEETLEKDTNAEKTMEEKEEKEDAERKEAENEKDQEEGTNEGKYQNQGIAGIQITQENWPDLASASKIRPSLPRRSKTMHRTVPVPEYGNMGKRHKNSLQ